MGRRRRIQRTGIRSKGIIKRRGRQDFVLF
jgi:hypothetical protein